MSFLRSTRKISTRKTASGTTLAVLAVAAPVLIGMMAVAIYTGVTAFVQDQLHTVAINSALAGAAGLHYDTATNDLPAANPAQAQAAALAVCNRHIANSPMLGNIGAACAVSPGANGATVQTNVTANVPTPFLCIVGACNVAFQAQASAVHAGQVYFNGSAPSQVSGPGCPAGGGGAYTQNFTVPVTDRPGPDLYVEVNSNAGYIVEGCTGNQCYDLGAAAHPYPGGSPLSARTHTYPDGSTRSVVYGSVFIDLGAISPVYGGPVSKLSSIRIVDDGVPDQIDAGGNRSIVGTACPGPLTINRVITIHSAMACMNGCPASLGPLRTNPLNGV